MKEKIYQYIIYAVIAVALTFSTFLLTTDNLLPFTTQATVHKNVANIAPEVAGNINQVFVSNGQHVQAGQLLFTIADSDYALAVRQAQAELDLAEQNHAAKSQALQGALQTLAQKQAQAANLKAKFKRYQALQRDGLVTAQEFDDIKLSDNMAQRGVAIAEADIARIRSELSNKDHNASIDLAGAKLAAAQLQLTKTQVHAQTDGTVTNLQLQAGSYINKGTVALFLVNEQAPWISADFNEKGMASLAPGTQVAVVFDALPGQVFDGKILNQDSAIYDASNVASQLANVSNDNRWIRAQQKIRTRIGVSDLTAPLMSGSKASVIVQHDNSLLSSLGYAWIKLLAWFRYVY